MFLPAVAPYNEELAWARKAAFLQRSCKLTISVYCSGFHQESRALLDAQESQHGNVDSCHLELVCSKLLDLLNKHSYQQTPGLTSLVGSFATSCISSEKQTDERMWWQICSCAFHHSVHLYRVHLNICCARFSEKQGTAFELPAPAKNQLL